MKDRPLRGLRALRSAGTARSLAGPGPRPCSQPSAGPGCHRVSGLLHFGPRPEGEAPSLHHPLPRLVGVSPRDWRGCSLVCAVVSPFLKKGKQLFSESRAVLVTDGSMLRNVSDRQRCVTLSSLLCPLLRASALWGGRGRPGAFRSGAKLAHVARG